MSLSIQESKIPEDFHQEEQSNESTYVDANGNINWDVALRTNESWLRSTISRQTGESAAADEVFQEVALAATRQKAPLRDPSKVGAWLYRLAKIQSALYRRTMGRKRNLLKRYENDVVTDLSDQMEKADPLEWLLRKERQKEVRKALNHLSEDERNILLLKYGENKSYREIADLVGTTESSVQSKLHRTRRRLRTLLSGLAENSSESF